jgi:piezo-type mechanosensitive ion channel component 1/2
MVLVAFFHVFLAVLDRIIYLKQNRTNLKLRHIYYNKSTGDRVDIDEYNRITHTNPNIEKLYTKTYLQYEPTNYPLICKYILHVFTVIVAHIFIFWYLPIQGNYNLHNYYYCDSLTECNNFHNNGYLIAFYIFYLLYMIFSAVQIHYGLLDMRKKSLLMRGDNWFYSTSFKIFNAIPFLYELKLMIDWSITPTSLDLFKWIKFESVYDRFFITHCYMKSENMRKVGDQMTLFNKISLGGCGFIIILLILLGPLILFSNLNPTNQINNITSAGIEVSLYFIIDGVNSNFTLFSNSYPKTIKNATVDDVFDNLNLNNTTLTMNFPKTQVQVTRMSNVSDTNWILAQPHIEFIRDNLLNYKKRDVEIYISFAYNFLRPVRIFFKKANLIFLHHLEF